MVFNISLGDGLHLSGHIFGGCCSQFFSAKRAESFQMKSSITLLIYRMVVLGTPINTENPAIIGL